jgi:hypothetical protein
LGVSREEVGVDGADELLVVVPKSTPLGVVDFGGGELLMVMKRSTERLSYREEREGSANLLGCRC